MAFDCLHRPLAAALTLLVLLWAAPASAVTRAINLGTAADLTGIAVLSNGTAVLVGSYVPSGVPMMWQIATNSSVTPTMLTGPGGVTRLGTASGISPDGNFIVGSLNKTGSPLPFQTDGALWARTAPTSPTIVPDLSDPFPSTKLRDVANTGYAVGASAQTAYRWSSSLGGGALPTIAASPSWAGGISANGAVAVGSATDDAVGYPVATVWNNGVYSVLDYNFSAAYGVSPNGRYIAGASDAYNDDQLLLNAAYWKDGQRKILYDKTGKAIDGQTLWATDVGIVGGFVGPTGAQPVDGWIYIEGMFNPISFNTWWKQITGTNFPIQVTSVTSAVEKDGELYLAIEEGSYFAQLRWAAPADANRDRVVDIADYTIWADNYLRPASTTFEKGDFTGDGKVDIADYTLWADNFNPAASPLASLAAVPEPSTWILGLTGMTAFLLAYISRRWRG